MAGKLPEFIAYLNRYGVAKTSHFRLHLPLKVTGQNVEAFSESDRVLGLRCEATELPGRQLVSNDTRTYGPAYKTPYQSLYQEITLTFLETSNFLIRGFFEIWMNAIFDSTTNKLSYPSTYYTTAILTQYDVNDGSRPNHVREPETLRSSLKEIAVWNLYNAFPTAINQMPVSWAEDGFHRTTVTLTFEWYSVVTGLNALNKPQPNLTAPVTPKRTDIP